jgi:hypothetical protein
MRNDGLILVTRGGVDRHHILLCWGFYIRRRAALTLEDVTEITPAVTPALPNDC